jgi:hypothetical protein
MSEQRTAGTGVWGMSGYQWMVVFAAWLGWGFDVFDGLLFNFVAPNCSRRCWVFLSVHPEARSVRVRLGPDVPPVAGLGAGRIIFGRFADRPGRTRTLMLRCCCIR